MKILVVDDAMASKYVEALILAGYMVESVPSGEQALRKIMQEGGYDLMIVTPRISDMEPVKLVKKCLMPLRSRMKTIVPIILAERHGDRITQNWFVIAPDEVESVKQAMRDCLNLHPPQKEKPVEQREGFFHCWFKDVWWQLGISW
ncbi:MAG: hypothetical protein ACD_81C00148G0001 [uncultured bacterium]|uniref:Response regulator receiver domain protein n=2 Tax=Candidatus Wolfeibacteriota TaxID=1752735 RepID=A0A0G1K5Z7_9BACT|nr:MAG: hypothetical protein ACD_81C00148G0001 [uncultured bacterium]KKR12351.1 MAG: Response regulator receiver domain protein [Candidatus Wolfebacteria bacterium GW2011_GWC2_39_22]KKT43259.1 MAG: Response regulator receiver domain protein [Candidatus Wolfebacteria bacterium GW2011_GWE2_44_13]HBI25978.1 hypothetical protein [Candidatus Wolfebacteria bacterium]